MQTHIRELEEEVKLLKNLSHPNIVVSTSSLLVFNCRFVCSFCIFFLMENSVSWLLEVFRNSEGGRDVKYTAGVCSWWFHFIIAGGIWLLP